MFDSPGAVTVLFSAATAVGVLVLAGLGSLLLSPNARRRRALARARQLLRQGDWQQALTLCGRQRQVRMPAEWQGKLDHLEGECRQAAAEAALAEGRYEESLAAFDQAAVLRGDDAAEPHLRVGAAMLAEVRRCFAVDSPELLRTALDLAERAIALTGSAEAAFWKGLCLLRTGDEEAAARALAEAHQAGGQRYIDPPLYLGALRLRQGQPQEALRHLSEANRIDATCPLVPWQLGLALVAAGGDARMALQALARALGPRGLGAWFRPTASDTSAQRLWAEGMPAERSFIPRLAKEQRFVCPLLGNDLKAMIRQGQLAMAQAQQRLGNFEAAADIYTQLLQDNPPTFGLLRGLGLALTRLGRYDQAFKHLRAALDLDPKDALTAGSLALCGALGKPTQDEDKPKNVLWAVRLLARFGVKNDPEWAQIVGLVLAEARSANVTVAVEELVPLCESLAAAGAADLNAAAAYDQLAGTAPRALRPRHAWLYCRAAQQHGFAGAHDLELFGLAFRDIAGLGAFYTERGWDLAEMEYCYLERWSQQRPGCFPEPLGPDYPPRGKEFLRERSRRLAAAGRPDEALAAAAVLALLAPDDAAAHDRVAYLCHRRGDLDQAALHLAEVCRLGPGDPQPLLRLAVLEQQRGQVAARRSAVRRALPLTTGPTRAAAALLGARLALQAALSTPPDPDLAEAATLLEVVLRIEPSHAEAAWQLAAVHALQGDRAGLAALALRLQRIDAAEPRFHHLAAVCHLAANDIPAARTAARQSATDESLAGDAHYLTGVAAVQEGDLAAALAPLQTAAASTAPSADHARALLGRVHWQLGRYEPAAEAWAALAPERRAAWQLDEPLRAAAFAAAVGAFHEKRYARAAQLLREANRLGCRDRRLEPLLQRALVAAGRQMLFAPPSDALPSDDPLAVLPLDPEAEAAADFLDQALKAGCSDPEVHYLRGVACRRAERFADARAAFRKSSKPESRVFLQLGVMSLQEGQLAQAEQEFARARELDPACYAACWNLLRTRLSLNQLDTAAELIEPARAAAPTPEEKRFLALLGALLQARRGAALLEMTPAEEGRLLELICGLGQIEASLTLLKVLTAGRRKSPAVQAAFFEAVLVQGKALVDRGQPGEAERLLAPWAARRTLPRNYQRSLRNLLGCCAVLNQDFATALRHFQTAMTRDDPPGDPRLPHNIALALELGGDPKAADPYWSRCFDLLEYHIQQPDGDPGGVARRMLFHGLMRLLVRLMEQEKWQAALASAERAYRVQPDHVALLERMFQIYQHLSRADGARWVLGQLRAVKPDDPVYELYEIDLVPVTGLKDVEHVLGEIERVLQQHAGEGRVADRAQGMALALASLLLRHYEAVSEEVERLKRRTRGRSPREINWDRIEGEAAQLRRELSRLRRLVVKCEELVRHPDYRRDVHELVARIDRKISTCDALAE